MRPGLCAAAEAHDDSTLDNHPCAAQIIYVNDGFDVEKAEGSHLTEDMVVGKMIAGGAQVPIPLLESAIACSAWSLPST
jgi:hypothetical protein